MDPALRGAMGASTEDAEEREAETVKALWEALARIPCPTLVVRGAASDILSPEIADRMVDEVLPNGRPVARAMSGYSRPVVAPRVEPEDSRAWHWPRGR